MEVPGQDVIAYIPLKIKNRRANSELALGSLLFPAKAGKTRICRFLGKCLKA